jgi:TIR domain-containing protein/uncharacterized protein DUF3298
MKIFLGYPSERMSEAKRVWTFLSSLGLDIWFNEDRVLPGQIWRREQDAAQETADLILHIISPEVLNRAGEVQRELKRTLELADSRPFGDMFLIPIRVEGAPLPTELSRFQYVDLQREDWQYRLCKSIALKFEKANVDAPPKLLQFLATEAAAGSRVDLRIRDVSEIRDLQADYFRYDFNSTYFEFINAEIASGVLSEYFSSRRDWRVPVPAYDGDVWTSSWSVQVEEFFRSDKLVSLRMQHYYYSAGAAHGNHGATTLNFGGEDIGQFRIADVFDHDSKVLKFLLKYSELALKQELLGAGENDNSDVLTGFDHYVTDQNEGWNLLSQFNFDTDGILFNFSPYSVLPYAFGSREVRIHWKNILEYMTADFKSALASILPSAQV